MSSENNILVKLKDAGIRQNDKWLVQGVSLEVEKGKIVTLIGPNKALFGEQASQILSRYEHKHDHVHSNDGSIKQKN